MSAFLLAIIVCSALFSLISYVYCWHDIRTGRPHIISLRQITSIMDRNRLNDLFGRHVTGYYYELTQTQLTHLIQIRRWFYISECSADALCIVAAWFALTGVTNPENTPLIVVLTGLCQGINLVYSFWLISKWHPQLREEIETSDD